MDVTGVRNGGSLPHAAQFEGVVEIVTPSEVPPPAWFAQARRNAAARQELLDEFGALSSDQIAELAGSTATNRRSTAHRWQAQRKIFGVQHHGRTLYPGFQFEQELGEPKTDVAHVLNALPQAMTGWSLALWWATPNDVLDWNRPADWLDGKPDRVIEAAEVESREWASADPSA